MQKESLTRKVLISLPEKFLSEIDIFANQEHCSRSELIRQALRQYVHSHKLPALSGAELVIDSF